MAKLTQITRVEFHTQITVQDLKNWLIGCNEAGGVLNGVTIWVEPDEEVKALLRKLDLRP